MDAEAACKVAGVNPELLERIKTLPPWSTDFAAAESVVLGAIDARRPLRPYRDIIAYRAPGKHRRERRKGHDRKPVWTRALNFLTIGQTTTFPSEEESSLEKPSILLLLARLRLASIRRMWKGRSGEMME